MTSATPKADSLSTPTGITSSPDASKALESGNHATTTPAPATSLTGDEKAVAESTEPVNPSVVDPSAARDRAGSTTSSRRSHNATAKPIDHKHLPNSVNNSSASAKPKQKRGLFAILGCCSSKDSSNDIDMKEAPRLQQSTTPSSPVTRSQRLKARLDRTASQEAKAAASGHTPSKEAPAPADASAAQSTVQSTSNQLAAQDIAARAVAPAAVLTDVPTSALSATPDVMVQAPTPVIPQQDQEKQIISDRTPEQEARDKDIEMTDVGPSIPLSSNDAAPRPRSTASTIDEAADNKSDLTTSTNEQSAITADPVTDAENEVPKGLLPPVRQEHTGRKCLILDLDETLVHSSFKVCCAALGTLVTPTYTSRFFTRPTSPFQSRLRVNTTMCM